MEVKQARSQPVQPVQQTRRPEQVEKSDTRGDSARAERLQAQKQQELRAQENKPRPNVNGQGQTIGTRLSEKA